MKHHQHSSQNGRWSISPIRCFLYVMLVILVGAVVVLLFPFPHSMGSMKGKEDSLTSSKILIDHLNGGEMKNNENLHLRYSKEEVLRQAMNTILPIVTTEEEEEPPFHTKPEKEKKKKTIAYAITVTKDGPFVDGALVLGYAAKKFHSEKFGFKSPYDAELVAFVTKSVVTTRSILSKFGWRIIERDLPVQLEEIENKDYAERMRNSGCCGADEFLKLWAYTLTEYYRVVHLDMDSIIFKNMDELYELPYELLFTGDYNMIAGSPYPPAQGGFLIVQPNIETFKEFQSIIRKGDHRPGSGWGGSKIGNFWGGQTIQGIVPYYYNILHQGKALELNRCQYNCMVDNPYHKGTTRCLDRKPTCEDCRIADINKVSSAHFTICQKPWTCTFHSNPNNKVLCEKFHAKWFALRDEFEQHLHLDTSYRKQQTKYKDSLGMCKGYGDDKYLPMPVNQVQGNLPDTFWK